MLQTLSRVLGWVQRVPHFFGLQILQANTIYSRAQRAPWKGFRGRL